VSTAPDLIAEEAGLRHVDVDDLTITRRRRGRGFSYLGPRGGRVDAAQRRWIEQLAIPPAWTDVRIAAAPDCHLLATGIDDAGRRQYRYHPGFRQVADDVKFARIAVLGARIGEVRCAVQDAIDSDDERWRLTGIVARLIDLTLMRVGTERYADEHDTYGASTLRCEHAARSGDALCLSFNAKSSKPQCIEVTDSDVVDFVDRRRRRRRASGSDPLFVTEAGWSVGGSDVKTLLSTAARIDVSAKDLRTWGASAAMVEALCEPPDGVERATDPVLAAYDHVADRLGNTRAVARGSYVAPAVEEAHGDNSLDRLWVSSRSSWQRSRSESTLDKVFDPGRTG
jgi:DNA topoisomerase I